MSEVTVDEQGFRSWEYEWEFFHDRQHGGESMPSGTTAIRQVDFMEWVEENIDQVPAGENRTLLDMYWREVHEQDVFDQYCEAHCPAELVEEDRENRRKRFNRWLESERVYADLKNKH